MLQRVLREAPSDEYLFSLAFSDLYWDRIKSIRRVGRKPTFVFDISVPDVENFVANGFIAHNTAEIKLPHPHWVPSVARVPIATVPGKEVDLYALLRESLRVRPDYIIVGEVRGPEAYILFQQIATGHPSMATIHAENMPRLIDRLTTAPISLPLSLIASLDIIVFMAAMTHKGKYVRKVTEVIEMREFDPKARKLLTDTIFKWNPLMDRWDAVTRSRVLGLISKLKAIPEAEIADELRRRMTVLNWMWEQGIKHYKDVYKVICDYYADPELVLRAAMMG
jgi:flagellar protein FlaI